ncbi:hypothetical protein [Neptunomonas antarctica]|uniref:GreA/GreB family elongation factor n=1 Tax=Neptunomonas antarctica TaxID=619304 RepID=A0A1N7PP38_9GAMM|nr:hypothetical protein [Neptunomonas antarctica]SIT12332.1 GreA/GreB family elongation factor [Neptunomonas antarctica]
MNKQQLLDQLLCRLQGELSTTQDAVNQAHDNAVHEQSKPENQYDTLALESAYLAHGQAVRAADLQRQVVILKHLKLPACSADSAVVVGALVQLRDALSGILQWLWLLPVAGGIDLRFDDMGITTITPEAPLGQKLLGNYIDDEIRLSLGSNKKCFHIVAVY